jgi:hypothetical protein
MDSDDWTRVMEEMKLAVDARTDCLGDDAESADVLFSLYIRMKDVWGTISDESYKTIQDLLLLELTNAYQRVGQAALDLALHEQSASRLRALRDGLQRPATPQTKQPAESKPARRRGRPAKIKNDDDSVTPTKKTSKTYALSGSVQDLILGVLNEQNAMTKDALIETITKQYGGNLDKQYLTAVISIMENKGALTTIDGNLHPVRKITA